MGRRKNRKKQSAGFIFPAPLAGVLLFFGAVAFGYLWLSNQCETVGAQIKQLEDRKTDLQKRVTIEEHKWATMKTPANIEQLLRHFNIEMIWPEKGRVVQVHVPAQREVPVQVAANTRRYGQESEIVRNE